MVLDDLVGNVHFRSDHIVSLFSCFSLVSILFKKKQEE